jgi:hypothetical protein
VGAGDVGVRDALWNTVEEPVSQRAVVCSAGIGFVIRKLQRRGHADDSGDVFGAGAALLLL